MTQNSPHSCRKRGKASVEGKAGFCYTKEHIHILSSMNTTTLIGVAGAALVLLGFVMTQFHEWKGDYFIYELCNFLGSLLLMVYAILLHSYPFLVLNGVWAAVALWYVIADLARNSHRRDHLFLHRRTFFQKWFE